MEFSQMSLKQLKLLQFTKKGSREEPGNYRPISVLPVIAKVFEKIVNKRLVDFLDSHSILYIQTSVWFP